MRTESSVNVRWLLSITSKSSWPTAYPFHSFHCHSDQFHTGSDWFHTHVTSASSFQGRGRVGLFCDPVDCSLPTLLCPWDFPGKNTGVDCHFLLQGIFLTQGWNLWPLHWQGHSLPLSHWGSPVQADVTSYTAHSVAHCVSHLCFGTSPAQRRN